MKRASQKSCCSDADENDAAYVFWQLGIPFESLCCTKEFEKTVIQNFIREYKTGRTPNPCIVCNRCLKFDRLLSLALEKGFDCLVTGHYARITQDRDTGRWQLRKALDGSKDQSYVLFMLSQQQLAHLRFPLGELRKTDARAIAEKAGLVTASKHESQDICFIPDGDYGAFLERWTGHHDPDGEILGPLETDEDGHVIVSTIGNNAPTAPSGNGTAPGGRVSPVTEESGAASREGQEDLIPGAPSVMPAGKTTEADDDDGPKATTGALRNAPGSVVTEETVSAGPGQVRDAETRSTETRSTETRDTETREVSPAPVTEAAPSGGPAASSDGPAAPAPVRTETQETTAAAAPQPVSDGPGDASVTPVSAVPAP